jgi:hypothetical protein
MATYAQENAENREKLQFSRLTPAKSQAYTSRVQPDSGGILGGAATLEMIADRLRNARLFHGSTHHLALNSQGVSYE